MISLGVNLKVKSINNLVTLFDLIQYPFPLLLLVLMLHAASAAASALHSLLSNLIKYDYEYIHAEPFVFIICELMVSSLNVQYVLHMYSYTCMQNTRDK